MILWKDLIGEFLFPGGKEEEGENKKGKWDFCCLKGSGRKSSLFLFLPLGAN